MLSFLRFFFVSIKHWFLDIVHPLPLTVTVRCSTSKTLDTVLMKAVQEMDTSRTLNVTASDHVTDMTMQVNKDKTFITDPISVFRYIGRLCRLYHIDPEHAAVVDSFLQLVSSVKTDKDVEHAMSQLEVMLHMSESTTPWMGNFSEKTIADWAWYATLMWAFEKYPDVYKTLPDHPMLEEWWDCVRDEDEEEEEEEEEEGEEEEDTAEVPEAKKEEESEKNQEEKKED